MLQVRRSFAALSSVSKRPTLALRSMASHTVLVPCANGSEDIELTCIVDTLRRAKFTVHVASVENGATVKLARGCVLTADTTVADVPSAAAYDAIALPGGMPGAERLRDSSRLIELLKEQKAAGKWYAAICASPAVVFTPHGLWEGVSRGTCYPTFTDRLPPSLAGQEGRVVVDAQAKCITSRGPGTAIEFALHIIACLSGREAALEVAKPMLLSQEQMLGLTG